LRHFLKVRGDEQSVTNSGKLFHACCPANAMTPPSNTWIWENTSVVFD